MASGCLPLFLDLERLPEQTLALYPRRHLAAALRLPGLAISTAISPSLSAGGRGGAEWYLQPAAFTLDAAALRPTLDLRPSLGPGSTEERALAAAALAPSSQLALPYTARSYWRLAAYVLAHARRHLSSSAMATHVRPTSCTLSMHLLLEHMLAMYFCALTMHSTVDLLWTYCGLTVAPHFLLPRPMPAHVAIL